MNSTNLEFFFFLVELDGRCWIMAYMVIPCMVPVVDDGSSKAPGWVDTSSSDGDGGQVHQENSKPNWEGSKDL